ncbi:MAG: hypothetical protein MI861_06050, partial [Pirellulales bacterium]|nr:hypothetical protein [Pirellulales bacterium]
DLPPPGGDLPPPEEGIGPGQRALPPRTFQPDQTRLPNLPRLAPSNAESNTFNQADPTQSAPDVRRILQGEQQQLRRDPLPPIEVVGKVIRADGSGKALLRVNERFFMVSTGTSFSVTRGIDPIVFVVGKIDADAVEIESREEKQKLRLP